MLAVLAVVAALTCGAVVRILLDGQLGGLEDWVGSAVIGLSAGLGVLYGQRLRRRRASGS